MRIQFCFKLINKTKVERVQLEKTLDFILRLNLLVQNFIASCHDFLARGAGGPDNPLMPEIAMSLGTTKTST